jgi:hypothetical protein
LSGSQHVYRRATRALGAAALALVLAVAAVVATERGPLGARPADARGVSNGNATQGDVAMNKDGDAIAIWVRDVDGLYRVEARYRPAGGSWGEPKVLSAPISGFLPPHVAIDDAGNAVAIWYRSIDGVGRIQTARRSAAGVWSAPKTLSPEGLHASYPDIVVDPAGNTTAAWTVTEAAVSRVQTASRPKGGAWSSVKTVSPGGEGGSFPVLATSSSGVTMLVWLVAGASGVKSVRRPAGGAWGPVVTVTQSSADVADVAMDAQARTTVAWRGVVDGTSAILARRRTSSGWGPVDVLSPAGSQASAFGNVAMTLGGDTFVGWGGVNNLHNRALMRQRLAGSGWSPLIRLSAVGQSADSPRVAVNARGDAIVVWNRFFDGANWVEASHRPAGGDWGLAREISEPGRQSAGAVVALGGNRVATVVFSAHDNGIFRLQTVTRSPGGSWSAPTFLSPLN